MFDEPSTWTPDGEGREWNPDRVHTDATGKPVGFCWSGGGQTGATNPKQSMAIWRQRDPQLLVWLEQPRTIEDSIEAEFFYTRQAAQKRMTKLLRKKKIKLVGNIMLNDCGRPRNVYCRNHIPHQLVWHEYGVTKAVDSLKNEGFVRGTEVDQTTKPDAEITINGTKVFLEFDSKTEGYKQYRNRTLAYANVSEAVLWVTTSETRRDGMMRRWRHQLGHAVFTVLNSLEWYYANGTRLSPEQMARFPHEDRQNGRQTGSQTWS